MYLYTDIGIPLSSGMPMRAETGSPVLAGQSHHMDHLPRLSLAERDRRWGLVRERMVDDGIEALILVGSDVFYDMGMANVRYLTHIADKSGALVVFPVEGDPVVWTG